jgi:hypothetical protein
VFTIKRKDAPHGLGLGRVDEWTYSFFTEAKKLSIGALSRQLQRRLIDL